jgi:hypothetical protein
MVITPEEFLKRALRLGMERSMFKQHMLHITSDMDTVNKQMQEGKRVYFAYDDSFTYLRVTVNTEDNMPERNNETYTDAFKLLRILAE